MATIVDVQSPFQHIVIEPETFSPGNITLYLDNTWQLATSGEHLYHESLISIPMAACPEVGRVLIAGGGDGMSLREALRFSDCREATLVEIDPVMVSLFRDQFASFNRHSMSDSRARVIIGDALEFAQTTPETFDFISLDFPSPSDQNLDKGYEGLLGPNTIRLFLKKLSPRGILSMQASIAPSHLADLVDEAALTGFHAWEYETYYTPFEYDGFIVFARHCPVLERPLSPGLKFATPDHVATAFAPSRRIGKNTTRYLRLFCDPSYQD